MNQENTVYRGVTEVIGELTGLKPTEIYAGHCLGACAEPNHFDIDCTLKPLDLDSMDRILLAMKLEERFQIEIPDDDVDKQELGHVGGLAAYVRGKVDAKPALFAE